MSFRINCPECDTANTVQDDMRGKKTRCRECDRLISIPAEEAEDEAADEAEAAIAETPGPKRRTRDDDDDRPAPRPAKKKSGGGAIAVAVVGCGSVAVFGVVAIVAIGVLWMVFWKNDAAPQPQPGQPMFVFGPDGPGMPPDFKDFNPGFKDFNPGPDILDNPGDKDAPPVIKDPPPNNDPPNKDGPPKDPAPAADKINAATIQKVKHSTVYLEVEMPNKTKASGSGFFAVEPGIIITNAHVLGMLRAQSRQPDKVDVIIHGGEPGELKLPGQVVGVDRSTDLAVVRVPTNGLPPPLPVHSAATLADLQKVYFMGFPFGKQVGTTVSTGEGSVSGLEKDRTGAITQVRFLGDMQPGNSGGPVVDASGRVVGIAVAIIKGTRINFAVPADFVKSVLNGQLAESSFGEPFLDNNQTKLPLKYVCLDPLLRLKSMRVEIWTGPQGPERPATSKAPAAQLGDSPRQSIDITYQDGTASGEILLPELPAGQVHWLQPVLVDSNGVTQWAAATSLAPSVPVQRVTANLQMNLDQLGDRTLHIKDTKRVTIFQGKAKFTEGLNFEAHVLESLTASPEGTRVRLTIGPNQFVDEFEGKRAPVDPQYPQRLRTLSPIYLMDATGKLRVRDNPADLAKLMAKDKDTLETMYNRVCNAFEQVALSMPNRPLNATKSWEAKVPTVVGRGAQKKVLDIELTCTYEGSHVVNNRNEAVIRLVGALKARDKADSALGRVVGKAKLDVDAGHLSQVNMNLTSEVELGNGLQMVMSEDISLTRVPGNTQNIVVAAAPKKDPDPKPKDPEVKPKDPEPQGPKVVLNVTGNIVKNDFLGTKARQFKAHEIKLEAGKTYLIEMKKSVPGSTFNPYLELRDSQDKIVAKDDDSGDNKNAKIIYTAPATGLYKVVATSVSGPTVGAYHLTVTADPVLKKE